MGKCEAAATISKEFGIGLSTTLKILTKYLNNHCVSSPKRTKSNRKSIWDQLDDFDKCAIWRLVHDFFHRNEIPTIDSLLKAVNDDEDLPTFSRTTLYR